MYTINIPNVDQQDFIPRPPNYIHLENNDYNTIYLQPGYLVEM